MTETMRAITAPEPGGPDAMTLETRPKPKPGPGEVRIAVAAAGVNRPDVLQRQGLYPPPQGASDVLGLEVSGHIDAIGEGVRQWRVGDGVCALLTGGGYAQAAIAPAGQCLPVPSGLSVEDAAALPETVFTVWANVFERARLAPGETLLVQGASGGIGSTAVQMAKAHGARVLAVAGGPDKAAKVAACGADRVIDYRAETVADVVKAEGGADVILDMLGGGHVQAHLDVLKADGRLVQIAFLEGATVEVDLMRLMLKRLTLTGSTLRARPAEEKARLAAAIRQTVWPWIEAGQVRPIIDARFALEDAASAHHRLEARGHIGKILLVP